MKAGIAGGGIMGLLMALHLVDSGWEVSVFDLTLHVNCSSAAAGLLSPLAELEKCDPLIHALGSAAVSVYWPAIISKLNQDIFFQKSGSLLLAHPRDRQELFRFIEIISARHKNPEQIRQLQRNDIEQLEPEITNFSEGFYLQGEAQIDSQQLLTALSDHLNHAGVMRYNHCAVVRTTPYRLDLQDRSFDFDLVLDCRGLGASQHFHGLRGMRGELIWVQAKDVHITRPVRLLHPRYGLYIVPRSEQTYLIGASEIESEDYSSISVRTMLELLTAANCVHSGFLEARILKTVTQCRPVLMHHLPQIKYAPGLIAINGLYRHGFLIAPALAQEVMTWITSGMTSTDFPELWEQAA